MCERTTFTFDRQQNNDIDHFQINSIASAQMAHHVHWHRLNLIQLNNHVLTILFTVFHCSNNYLGLPANDMHLAIENINLNDFLEYVAAIDLQMFQ